MIVAELTLLLMCFLASISRTAIVFLDLESAIDLALVLNYSEFFTLILGRNTLEGDRKASA